MLSLGGTTDLLWSHSPQPYQPVFCSVWGRHHGQDHKAGDDSLGDSALLGACKAP